MNYFKNLPVTEFLSWPKNNPEDKRSMASELAYTRVFMARKELKEFEVVADRTEGKAPQTIRHEGEIQTGAREVAEALQEILKDDDGKEKKSDQANS